MLGISVAAILGVDDGARGYYHYSDRPKYTHDYNDLPTRCCCEYYRDWPARLVNVV
jgi:hypothetical protein